MMLSTTEIQSRGFTGGTNEHHEESTPFTGQNRLLSEVELWEILVPTIRPNGKPFRTRYHRVWDAKVREITNGLTILPVSKGHWISPAGELFVERMIPVRIVASRQQIEDIINLTIKYYEQEAVLAYKMSDEVILQHRLTKPKKSDIKETNV